MENIVSGKGRAPELEGGRLTLAKADRYYRRWHQYRQAGGSNDVLHGLSAEAAATVQQLVCVALGRPGVPEPDEEEVDMTARILGVEPDTSEAEATAEVDPPEYRDPVAEARCLAEQQMANDALVEHALAGRGSDEALELLESLRQATARLRKLQLLPPKPEGSIQLSRRLDGSTLEIPPGKLTPRRVIGLLLHANGVEKRDLETRLRSVSFASYDIPSWIAYQQEFQRLLRWAPFMADQVCTEDSQEFLNIFMFNLAGKGEAFDAVLDMFIRLPVEKTPRTLRDLITYVDVEVRRDCESLAGRLRQRGAVDSAANYYTSPWYDAAGRGKATQDRGKGSAPRPPPGPKPKADKPDPKPPRNPNPKPDKPDKPGKPGRQPRFIQLPESARKKGTRPENCPSHFTAQCGGCLRWFPGKSGESCWHCDPSTRPSNKNKEAAAAPGKNPPRRDGLRKRDSDGKAITADKVGAIVEVPQLRRVRELTAQQLDLLQSCEAQGGDPDLDSEEMMAAMDEGKCSTWGLLEAMAGNEPCVLRLDTGLLQDAHDGLVTPGMAAWLIQVSTEPPILERVKQQRLRCPTGTVGPYATLTAELCINTKGALPHSHVKALLTFAVVPRMFGDELPDGAPPAGYLGKKGCHTLGIAPMHHPDGSVHILWLPRDGGREGKDEDTPAPIVAAAVTGGAPPVLESDTTTVVLQSGVEEAMSIFTHRHAQELKEILAPWPNITQDHYREAARLIPGFVHYDPGHPRVAEALAALKLDTKDEPQVEGPADFMAAVIQAHKDYLVPRSRLMFPALVEPVRLKEIPGFENVTANASHGPIKEATLRTMTETLLDSWEVLHFAIAWPFTKNCASFVFPRKEDGTRRPTLDLRLLNRYLLPVDLELPNLADIFQQIGAAAVVGILDATQAFFQIPLHMDDWGRIAFDHPTKGRMALIRLPQGAKTATAEFAARVNAILSPVPKSALFVDDCSLYADSHQEYIRTLRHTLAILADANVVLKIAKCKHGLPRLKILGHDLEVGVGVSPSDSSIRAILEADPPRDRSQLMALNGLINWVGRRHVSDLARRMAPITDLLADAGPRANGRDATPWTKQAEDAFADLKQEVASSRVQLVVPTTDSADYRVELAVTFDASEIGAGGTLWQRVVWQEGKRPDNPTRPLDGEWHPLEFYSRKWSRAERRRNVTEKECLALVLCTRTWWRYLTGRRFTAFTDHRNLIFMRASKNRKVIRWDSELSAFHFEVYHVPGETNVLPDFLSRCGHPTLDEMPADRGDQLAAITRSQTTTEAPTSPPDPILDGDGTPDPILMGNANHGDDVNLDSSLLTTLNAEDRRFLAEHAYTECSGGRWCDPEGNIYVPIGARPAVLVCLHEHGGHFGVRRCHQQLRASQLRWPHDRRDVARHVASCPQCQLVKADTVLHEGPLESPMWEPGDVLSLGWEVDVAGPIRPQSTLGFTHILMCVELGYRYVELIPIVAPVTAECLLVAFRDRVIYRYGPPVIVKSDGARNLDSSLAEEFFRLLKTKHHVGTPHRPQSQGRAERHIGVMMRVARATLMEAGGDWGELLPAVQWLMNASHSSVTGFTPYQMLFGSPPTTTLTLVSRLEAAQEQYRARMALDPDDWIAQLVSQHGLMLDAFRKNQAAAMDKSRTNARRTPWPVFTVGDAVMVYFRKKLGKLDTHWRGPFRVVERGHLHTYTVQMVGDPRRSYVVHAERLRTFDAARMPGPTLQCRRMTGARYMVDEVTDVKTTAQGKLAFVKWQGFEAEDSTWEPLALVKNLRAYADYLSKV